VSRVKNVSDRAAGARVITLVDQGSGMRLFPVHRTTQHFCESLKFWTGIKRLDRKAPTSTDNLFKDGSCFASLRYDSRTCVQQSPARHSIGFALQLLIRFSEVRAVRALEAIGNGCLLFLCL